MVYLRNNISFSIISILFTSFSYSQPIPDTTHFSLNTQLTTNSGDPLSSCLIPQDVDIIHFPIKSWDTHADFLKKLQKTITTVKQKADDTIEFIERTWKDITTKKDDIKLNKGVRKPNNNHTDIVEETAYPQFILAKLIQNNPNSFIFHEFVTRIYDSRYLNNLAPWDADTIIAPDQLPNIENRRPEHLFYLVRAQFPDGLPEKYIYLDKDQKYTLAITGAVHTLFFLDQLPVIFPSISSTDLQKINTPPHDYCKNYYYDLFNVCSSSNYILGMFRAEKLTSIVNNFLNTLSNSQREKQIAILAYRDTHDLSPYFSNKNFYKVPNNCLSIKIE